MGKSEGKLSRTTVVAGSVPHPRDPGQVPAGRAGRPPPRAPVVEKVGDSAGGEDSPAARCPAPTCLLRWQ